MLGGSHPSLPQLMEDGRGVFPLPPASCATVSLQATDTSPTPICASAPHKSSLAAPRSLSRSRVYKPPSSLP